MTDSLIPLPSDAIYWREQLFNLVAPVTMTAEKFEEIWPLISQYECRLGNHGSLQVELRANNSDLEETNLKRRLCSTQRSQNLQCYYI